MTEPAIRANLDQPLDVHGDVLAQVAFDRAFRLDDLTNPVHLVFVQVLHLLVGIDIGGLQNLVRPRVADAEDIRQSDHRALVTG